MVKPILKKPSDGRWFHINTLPLYLNIGIFLSGTSTLFSNCDLIWTFLWIVGACVWQEVPVQSQSDGAHWGPGLWGDVLLFPVRQVWPEENISLGAVVNACSIHRYRLRSGHHRLYHFTLPDRRIAAGECIRVTLDFLSKGHAILANFINKT